MYFIYQLVDPRDNLPRYVGMTIDPDRRLQDYLMRGPHSRKLRRWFDDLGQFQLQPTMDLLEAFDGTAQDAQRREVYWVKQLLNQGILLLNSQNDDAERVQLTVYLPPGLAKWVRVQARKEEREISEIAADAFDMYRESRD